ncbi:CapA family protein [Nitrosomonas sp. JL21]|nr:CapA family protein [Nitrosomonas sp. JL21]
MIISNPIYSQDQTIRMLFVGDMMLDELPGEMIREGKNPFAAFDELFEQADITVGNLECVISEQGVPEKKPFTFRAHPRVIPILKKYFSAVSLANNHSGDYGPLAFTDMLDLLEQSGVAYFGGGRDIRFAHQPYIIDIKGKKVAFLGFNEFLPRSFEALDDRAGVAWSDDDYVIYDIQRAKTEFKADMVIVYPHWGIEWKQSASSRQMKLARLMIDAGASAVVGGHPHVTQNIEWYKGKPIFYSLGNFIFNGFEKESNARLGWALELIVTPDMQISWKIHKAKLDDNGIPHYDGELMISP